MNKSFQLLRLLFLGIGAGIAFTGNAQPVTPPTAYSGTMPVNYVRTWTAVKPEINANNIGLSAGPTDFKIATQYFDGLGRPLQTVVKQGSMVTGASAKDFVTPIVYDAYGRESLTYLTFASTTSDGSFKTNPFQQQVSFYNGQLTGQTGEFNIGTSNLNWAYGQSQFEASPLSRVTETFAPGSSWVGTASEPVEQNRHSAKSKYWLNTTTDNVKIWKVLESATFLNPTYNLVVKVTPNGTSQTILYSWGNLPPASTAVTVRYRTLPSGTWHTSTGSASSPRTISAPPGEYEYGILVHQSGLPDEQVTAAQSLPDIQYSIPGSYVAGALFKAVSVDENGKQVITFKDKLGKTILKKNQLTASADNGSGSGHSGWLCTYYVYDDRENLSLVIQPAGVETLDGLPWPSNLNSHSTWAIIFQEQCFQYVYDTRNRLIKKKVPGTYGGMSMVYDKQNRLILTQDGNMAAQGKWMVNILDGLGRLVKTVQWTNANDQPFHAAQAAANSAYPDLTGQTYEVLTETFYDSYDWLASNGNPFSSNRSTTDDGALFNPTNSSYPYPQTLNQSMQVRGLATGTKTKVLGTSQFLYSINYYDNSNRLLQDIVQNITGGQTVTTYQYTFNGEILATYTASNNANPGATQGHSIRTINDFDALGRIVSLKKAVFTPNGVGNTGEKVIAQYEYDALGQIKKKKLAPAYNSNAGLETLDYDYNVRGWALGVNRNYLLDPTDASYTSRYFGFELGYDKLSNKSGRNFKPGINNGEFNRNVNGIVWKSAGDKVRRKYDFEYDAASRLLLGEFEQEDAPTSWSNSVMNYSIKIGDGTNPTSAFDPNGNIKEMTQYGWKLGGSPSTPIDQLYYAYQTNSNKLDRVTDSQNDPNTKLGDFHDGGNVSGTADYNYDNNGNLTLDNNKSISAISYNYLNLPQLITVTGKGSIEYTYDAAGNKLKKVITDQTVNPTKITTTYYIGNSVYENNELKFTGIEEGRIRFAKATTATCSPLGDRFVFDYFVKDHLGNVRMVLTDQREDICYIPATVEDARYTTEDDIYSIVNGRRVDKVTAGASSVTSFENKVYRVHGGLAGEKTGLGITLKVMSGDKVRITAESFYTMPGGGPGSPAALGLTELLTAFVGSPTVAAAGHGGITTGAISNTGGNTTLIPAFLGTQNEGGNNARAFVNWILFDEQFKFVDGRADPVQPNGGYKLHDVFINTPALASKSGYLYVYVSNESNLPVYFDNLGVTHVVGPLLEESHYYPFGLVMTGISSKALSFGAIENMYKFNSGTELASKEFNDGSGLNWYEATFRSFDPQIGRFHQMDPLSEITDNWTPYAFCNNNPVLFSDPFGLDTTIVIDGKSYNFTDSEMKSSVTVTGAKPKQQTAQTTKDTPANQAGLPAPNIFPLYPVPNNPLTVVGPSPAPRPSFLPVLGRIGGTIAGVVMPTVGGLAPGTVYDPYATAPLAYPWGGHGNDGRNTNPHIVYYFVYNARPGESNILKYGISDYLRNKISRPEKQIEGFRKKYGKNVYYVIYTRTLNREQAEFIEKLMVTQHVNRWGYKPIEQDRPGPFTPPYRFF